MTDTALDEAKLVGGSLQNRRRLLERMHEYLDINARFDWVPLQDLWSGMPEAEFFNLNGHTYKGREHWTRLWQFYQQNVASGYWAPFDIGGIVSDELAVIWCHRQTRSEWVGKEPPVGPRRYGTDHITRSTMVFRKESGDWRVVHVHFSEAATTPRPGNI